jgi:hypothetical protein
MPCGAEVDLKHEAGAARGEGEDEEQAGAAIEGHSLEHREYEVAVLMFTAEDNFSWLHDGYNGAKLAGIRHMQVSIRIPVEEQQPFKEYMTECSEVLRQVIRAPHHCVCPSSLFAVSVFPNKTKQNKRERGGGGA